MSVNINIGANAKPAMGEIDKLKGKLGELSSSKGFQNAIMGVGVGAGVSAFNAVTAAIGQIPGAAMDAINAASDLSEATNKADVIFGSAAKSVRQFADTAATSMGASKTEALSAASAFGNLFNVVGLGEKASADMSLKMSQLAGDLASFNNIGVVDALEKLRSGLVGEAEPLRSMGIMLSEAAVAAKAVELGLAKTTNQVSEGAKVQARYALILEQSKSAQGDFSRTSDGLANSQRILSAEIENLKTDIGNELLPVMQMLVTWMKNDLLPTLQDMVTFIKENKDAIGLLGQIIGIAVSAFGPYQAALDAQNDKLRAMKDALDAQRAAQDAASESSEGHTVALYALAAQAAVTANQVVVSFETASEAMRTEVTAAVDKQLADLKTKLSDAKAAFNNFKTTVSAAIRSAFSFSEAHETGTKTGQTFVQALTEKAKEATTFANRVKTLIKMGLSPDALTEVLNAGTTAGSDIAKQLIEGGSKAIETTNKLTAAAQKAADNIGTFAANSYYRAGITTAQKTVDGFEAQFKEGGPGWNRVMATMNRLAVGASRAIELTVSASSAPARAAGGPVSAGRAYIVGERGPELFVPPAGGGTIVPNNRLGASGGVNVNVTVQGAALFDPYGTAAQQLAGALLPGLRRELTRQGMTLA